MTERKWRSWRGRNLDREKKKSWGVGYGIQRELLDKKKNKREHERQKEEYKKEAEEKK